MLCCKKGEEKPAPKAVEIPDGGWGWAVVGAAFVVQWIVLGTMNNFGILYVELLQGFEGADSSTVSWIGSITYGMMFLLGPITTSLCQKYGCRLIGFVGGLIAGCGCFLASFSPNLYVHMMTYGVMFGLGASMCYFPTVCILPSFFWKRLALANGLVSSGSGIGTMAMGPVIAYLVNKVGWANTNRASAAMMGLTVICAGLFYRQNYTFLDERRDNEKKREAEQGKKSSFLDLSVFKNKAYIVWCSALFVFMLGYFVPFVHLVRHAEDCGIPREKASLLVGIMSVGSTFGRLFFGRISDHPRVNRLYIYQLAFLSMGIGNTLLPLLTSFTGIVFYCISFGVFEGVYVALASVLTADIVGRDKLAPGIGMLFGIKSIPLTVGPPFAGFLYDISNSYQAAFYVAGAVPIFSCCLMFLIPFLMPENQGIHEHNAEVLKEKEMLEYQLDSAYSSATLDEDGQGTIVRLQPDSISQIRVCVYPPAEDTPQGAFGGVRETHLLSGDAGATSSLSRFRGLSASVMSLVQKYHEGIPKTVLSTDISSMHSVPGIPDNTQMTYTVDGKLLVVARETCV